MKNVLIYNKLENKKKYEDNVLDRYIKAQIHNSLDLGWDKEDIILATNFDFEHMGIKNVQLNNVFKPNGYMNKWFGMGELMDGVLKGEDFWFHDQDNWPTMKFDFPEFEGHVGGCEYIGTIEWNTASIFVKKDGKSTIDYITQSAEMNEEYWKLPQNVNDETLMSAIRHYGEINSFMSSLNTEYNVGCTHFDKRYAFANKPVKVFGFKPDIEKDYSIMEDYIDDRLKDIFKLYKLRG